MESNERLELRMEQFLKTLQCDGLTIRNYAYPDLYGIYKNNAFIYFLTTSSQNLRTSTRIGDGEGHHIYHYTYNGNYVEDVVDDVALSYREFVKEEATKVGLTACLVAPP